MLSRLLSLDCSAFSLHVDELVEGALTAMRGCATRVGSFWWGGTPGPSASGEVCATSLVVDIAFLA
ncbi:MAG TPA: hypothetical protein VIK91_18640, partial [Nannocystis sp.]